MFKFDFSGPSIGSTQAPAGSEPACAETAAPTVYCEAAREVSPEEAAVAGRPSELVKVCDGLQLLKGSVTNSQAASLLGVGDVALADLIPGAYEGGFKLWECALDLAAVVAQELCDVAAPRPQRIQGGPAPAAPDSFQPPPGRAMPGQRVLELGCGHGLPGVVALLGGAEVHFQDYNAVVLQSLTAPNAEANWQAWHARQAGAARVARPSCRYFSGDWDSFSALLQQLGLGGGYDLVLSAETIYSPAAAASLLACIKASLRRPGGAAYVAAKSYYFGVGGGTAAFQQLVDRDGALRVEGRRVFDDGVSNRREILKLAWVPVRAA